MHVRATHARSIKRAFTIDQRSIEVDHELKTVVTRGERGDPGNYLLASVNTWLQRRRGGGPRSANVAPRCGCAHAEDAPIRCTRTRTVHRGRNTRLRRDFSLGMAGMRPVGFLGANFQRSSRPRTVRTEPGPCSGNRRRGSGTGRTWVRDMGYSMHSLRDISEPKLRGPT